MENSVRNITLVSKSNSVKNANIKLHKTKYNKDGSIRKTHSNKKEGDKSEVYAFKTKEEIKSLVDVLDKHIKESKTEYLRRTAERNKLLFLVGMNIGIRASDLCQVTWGFFFKNLNGDFNKSYSFKPQKTKKSGKYVTLYFNDTVKKAVLNYVKRYPIKSLDEYVFVSSKTKEIIKPAAIWRIVKETAEEAGIEQNIGSHSLRKSWGYWCWHEAEDKQKALVILQQCFAHSSTAMTAKYIGILDEEIDDMYNSVNLGLDFI